jgi:HK97 family phage major capsid protein
LYNAAEADQLLNGNGTSPNLKGLNTSGNFTAASGAATIHIEQIVQGILQMRILKRRPSGIIINPGILESLILNKATGGSEEYNLPSVVTMSSMGQFMVMGVPVVDVAEQGASTFTIHDNTGSLYAVRQGLTIEFFDQTYATTNKILIRIESRIAFPNFGATYTVKGTFSA